MIGNLLRQNEGVIVQVVPNLTGDNSTTEQLIALIQDIRTNKLDEVLKFKKDFVDFSKVKKNLSNILNVFLTHPNVISYEIYSDEKITCFNFWMPKKISKQFINLVYRVWDGSKIHIYSKDYISFDINRTTFSTIRFQEDSVFPTRIGKDTDLISRLVPYLENLEIDEKVLLQIVLRPIGTDWQEYASGNYKKIKQGRKVVKGRIKSFISNTLNEVLTIFTKDIADLDKNHKIDLKEIAQKVNQKGFQVTIRLAVQSDSKDRAAFLSNSILNVFKIMEGTEATYNSFIRRELLPTQNKHKFYQQMKERKVPVVSLNHTDIWVSNEIANFLRMPDGDVKSTKINRVNVRQTNVEDNLRHDSGLRMGKHTQSGQTYDIYWDTKDFDTLMRPVLHISNPGEGKSIMLVNKFLDWANLGFGGAVLDVADGKVVDNILYHIHSRFPHLKEKVVIIDCNDLENPPGVSDFSESKKHDRAISQMLSQLWTEFYINYFGIDDHHRSKDFIRKSSIPIFHFPENTILEQYLMISSEEYREEFMEKIQPIRRLFKYWVWWNTFNAKPWKVKNEETKAILNKFDILMDNDNLKNVVCQRNPKVPKFRDLMDDRKLILIKAGEGAFGYEGSRVFGALCLMKFWMAALSRWDLDEDKRVPFKVFCDEPQNYIASGNYIKEMLAKSRKYRLGLEFYFQDPAQIEEKDKYLLDLLISMNPHLVLGKMGDDQYKKYFKERIAPIHPKEGAVLPAYHWITCIYKEKNPVPPFIMEAVDMPPNLKKEQISSAKVWVNTIKKKYTRPVEEVEKDIQQRELAGYTFDSTNNIQGNAVNI